MESSLSLPLQEDVDFLAHFGVKGQKWGVRKANRARNRELNRKSREKDKVKYQTEIDKARRNIESGKVQKNLYEAKNQYKTNKVNLGSREAKKILAEKRAKAEEEYLIAAQTRDGKELATTLVAALGLMTLGAFLDNKQPNGG